jgi:hypothetical protein
LRGVSKDSSGALVAHPSRLAVKNSEHLRMNPFAYCRNANVEIVDDHV